MNKFWLILGQTYLNKIKTKSFIITTVITLLLMLGVTNIDRIFQAFENEDEVKSKIAVIDESGKLFSLFNENMSELDKKIQIEKAKENESELDKRVLEGDIDGYVILSSTENEIIRGTYKSMSMTETDIPYTIEQALQQVKIKIGSEKLNLNSEQLDQLFSAVQLKKVALEENAKSEEELNQARVLVYILLFIIYFSVIFYASMIAMEVATEKSSRVMEILISSVSPVQHMFAKILGIGLLSLTQLALILIVTFGSLKANLSNLQNMAGGFLGFSDLPASTFIYAGIFFLLGYFLFATLAAFLGSLVSRIEDVNQMITPMTLLIVAAFMIAMFGLGNPEAPFITITSYIPFFTPMIMFLRVGLLNLPFWEIALSIGVLLGTIILLAVIGARIYKGGVLFYGKTPSWKDVKKVLELTKKD
ncbi:ABC transporter permease [Metabacillus fastidiosus]|uniref:ABC transporter permease n=1 Tax=Metabacillus fastidiosus TaxID=1458 RepID=UPI002DC04334|nr:ABC transporter permease [Metabacillus fastidiosus]MEC2077956.1 ABC transporter permease [Metabacillus fastidiosus]